MVLTRYGLYLAHEKGASDNTCSNYLRDLRQLQTYLEGNCLETMEQVSTKSLQTYVDQLEAAGKSRASIARFVAAAKGYFTYLKTMQLRRDNPVAALRVGAVEPKVPHILSIEEINRLLQAPKCVDAKGYRDRSMLSVLYATGMCVSELLALDITDVDLFGSSIRCGKGDKARLIPLYPEAVAGLSQYVGGARPTIITDVSQQALFVNMSGKRMSRQGFWKLMKTYQVEAGIQTELTPHTLRHSFAVHLLEHGADMGAVQQLMGHAHISTTKTYGQLLSPHLRQVYLKTHPKA